MDVDKIIFATKQYCSKKDPLEVVQFMDLLNIIALAVEMERNEFPQPTLEELLTSEEYGNTSQRKLD